mmetsp:Transcript_11501/g.12810  ORF Transcript_11501/g.12810 Transcript_11501/m.12810 type:complete len:185 (-) Transcript_11501:291-845(-)
MLKYRDLVFMAMFCLGHLNAFVLLPSQIRLSTPLSKPNFQVSLNAATDEKAVKDVTGEELELMLTEWDTPLLVDAYATWCGPCLLMAPEFEAAAKELEGKVRFVKIDTDKEPEMAGRLNVMGLPTLMFLDQLKAPEGDSEGEEGGDGQPMAVLKDRIEGALRKDSILALCEYHFFDGPRPDQVM